MDQNQLGNRAAGGSLSDIALRPGMVQTARHSTSYLEVGPGDGQLMIFVHGWPAIGLIWRQQMTHFAAAGWRCIAPDMRGYGGSSVPGREIDYAVQEITTDLVELHDALGGLPALWVGHDWGCAPVWAMAAHHSARCRAVVALCVPYFARGFTLPNIAATVDRSLYPADRYPVGQWDYWLYHREHAGAAAVELEADVAATITALYRRTSSDVVGKPSRFADVRATGGFFGPDGRAPVMSPDETMLPAADRETFVAEFRYGRFIGDPTPEHVMTDRIRLLTLAAALSLGIVGPAEAHAHLKTSTPAMGATVAMAPSELDLSFSEGVNPKFTGVKVTGPAGAVAPTGEAKLGPAVIRCWSSR